MIILNVVLKPVGGLLVRAHCKEGTQSICPLVNGDATDGWAIVLVIWVLLNSFVLITYRESFDPYPYILLNLFLSMLAAIQAPIILMSQNRQAYKDRVSAEHDYEVNLKAELEIMALHEKIDLLREKQWSELISIQQEQLGLLSQLIKDLKKNQ